MRAFAVLGPPQSGKTTLIAAMAGLEGSRSKTDALLGGSSITTFKYMGDDWAAIDIPGGHDSLALAGPALAACDAGGGTFNASISGDAAQGFDTGSRTGSHNYRLSGSRYGMR